MVQLVYNNKILATIPKEDFDQDHDEKISLLKKQLAIEKKINAEMIETQFCIDIA